MTKNIKNNMTPMLPFIRECLKPVQKEIEADLFLWLGGKKYPNLKFDGSLVLVYWGTYLEGHIYKIIETAFTANRQLALEHDLDPANSANDATLASQEAVKDILNKMADYDQKMRGEGYPQRVIKKDVTEIQQRYFKIIQARAENEIAFFNLPKKNTIKLPLTADHSFWWFIKHCHWSVYLWLIPVLFLLLLSAFTLGLGAARNDSFLRVYDAVKSAFSTQPINKPIPPATEHQNKNHIKK